MVIAAFKKGELPIEYATTDELIDAFNDATRGCKCAPKTAGWKLLNIINSAIAHIDVNGNTTFSYTGNIYELGQERTPDKLLLQPLVKNTQDASIEFCFGNDTFMFYGTPVMFILLFKEIEKIGFDTLYTAIMAGKVL